MTGAILKVEYHQSGDKVANSFITGCFFFVTKDTIATCLHVLTLENLLPKHGYKYVQIFLLFGNEQYELTNEKRIEVPDLDLLFIKLKKSFEMEEPDISGTQFIYEFGTKVRNECYQLEAKPLSNTAWVNNRLVIEKHHLDKCMIKYKGVIDSRMNLDSRTNMKEFKAVKYKNALVFGVSWASNNGSSGSAVFDDDDSDTIIGMVVGGPGDEKIKNRIKHTYALSSFQIYEQMKLKGILKPWWKFW